MSTDEISPSGAAGAGATERKLRDYLRRVTAELGQTRERLHRAESGAGEPIAIVGMACRYPGGVTSPDDLWHLVDSGGDAIGPFPADRGWELADGVSVTAQGGFLEGAADFDPGFFGIGPREALVMDPQHRLLLESSWEALESGGIDPRSLRGTDAGVFVGVMYSDYTSNLHLMPEGAVAYLSTSASSAVASGRISYTLGLQGPAVTLDTACSSSLVALHLAAHALRTGESSLALAGGVTVMSTPGTFVAFSAQNGLSSDGRCKAFADAADGTGWSEGVGVLVLEKLSDARRNDHPVLAVLRGSAVNSDGASSGLTVPNGPAQQRLILGALRNAGLGPADVDVVEAHGTGTTLGDPIEAQALLATYGQDRRPGRPLWLGSVKSNLGHTQAAAGVAGVIKMVQAMRHETLPATLHVDAPTSQVDWGSGAVSLLTSSQPWTADGDRPRRAGLSSFGLSGTNAHVIVEQGDPVVAPGIPTDREQPPVALVVTARTTTALATRAARLLPLTAAPRDLAFSLATTRTAFEHRAVVAAADPERIAAALRALASGAEHPALVRGTAGDPGRVVFVFPGQGSQWAGMALELASSSPVFAARLAECASALESYVDWSLDDALHGRVDVDRVDVVQPVLFAVMVSLAAQWRAWGIEPDAVVGHSQGEIAAACVAGALSLDDAARVVALRSRVLRRLAGRGGMVSVALSRNEIETRIAAFGERVSVAAVNGPSAVVVSGEPGALEELLAGCERDGVRARRVSVDYASHSAQVDDLEAELAEVLAPVVPRAGEIPVYSTLTGQVEDGSGMDAGYWFRNLRSTVAFADAVDALSAAGFGSFVECSPHPILTMAVAEQAPDAVAAGSLRRDDGGLDRLLLSLGELVVAGVTPDWAAVLPGGRRIDLPTYPFEHRPFWPRPADPATAPAAAPASDDDELWRAISGGDPDALARILDVDPSAPLRTVVPALADRRRQHRTAAVADGWRYRIEWEPVPPGTAGPAGTWFVLRPESPDAQLDAAVTALRDSGTTVVEIPAPTDHDRAALAGLLRPLLDAHAPAGVLSALSLDEDPHPAHPAAVAGHAATVALLQALGDLRCPAPLWCLTRGAVATGVTGDHPTGASPEQALVWGVGRVAALEHPDRWGGLLDLPQPGAPGVALAPAVVAGLLAALAGSTGEDQLALRPTGLLARRIARAAVGDGAGWEPRGTVLVTGGTGGIGAQVARRLARGGVDELVLVSRRGADAPGADELVADIVAAGTRARVEACDLSDRAAAAALLDGLHLDAVIHTAAVLDDGVVDALTPDRLGRVLAVKRDATLHLHELTRHHDLDAFVLFSSMAGTFGASGQANYAPGNAFQDAFAHRRHALGLPATSVAWGPWSGGGMAEGTIGDLAGRHGLPAMDADLAVVAMTRAVGNGDVNVTVADVDWDRFLVAMTATRSSRMLHRVPEVQRLLAAAATDTTTAPDEPAGEFTGLDPATARARLLDLVRTVVAPVLGYDTAADVEPTRSFKDLGFDSVTAVELRNRLAGRTGLTLPVTLVFDHPTPRALADHLLAQLAPDGDDTTTGADAPARAATDDDPVVVVGMACRFPGGVSTPDQLWELVADGRDATGPFPADRGWDLDLVYASASADSARVFHGGFVDDVADFDAAFFGISPREALAMDPQQRLLLQTSWEALERAGVDPRSLHGAGVGVYAGTNGQDYTTLLTTRASGLEGQIAVGNTAGALSGRVSYTLGLQGPAVTVDTACSSSLVALHLAAQALRTGECSLALAGGVTAMSTSSLFSEFAVQGGLAADGRCKAFAAAANGAGFGEGAGMIVLERLSDAHRNGHPVLAVVRGSAVNSDGASNGITAPSGPAQQRVIRAALADAGVSPADVDVVEAHGTGTTLGDPIEASALLATYGGVDRGAPLHVGSIKSNIGHTQAAAGVAGVLKVVLALQHGTVPQTLHVDAPSPHVNWAAGAVRVATESVPWPSGPGPRRAGVSSFGISGTNAHVIIEHPADVAGPATGPDPADRPAVLALALSGRTRAALTAQARRFTAPLAEHDPADVAFSAATTRTAFEHRAVVVGADRDALLAGVHALAAGAPADGVVEGVAGEPGRVVFVFPGQGSQWAGMALELASSSPVFAERLAECGTALGSYVDWSLDDALHGRIDTDRVDVVQPVLFAVMVSLAAQWRSWGVEPDAVVGHSQGEIAAACVAGALSLDDAARVVALRSQVLRRLAGRGGMVSVALSRNEIESRIAGFGDRVSVAAVNGPSAVVVSGEPAALDELVAGCEADGVRARRVSVDYASHSVQVDSLEAELAEVLAPVSPRVGEIPVYSTLTGTVEDGSGMDAGYWFRNLRSTVAFSDAVESLSADGFGTFVECSPHPVLTMAVAEQAPDVTAVGSLRRDDGGLDRLLLSLGELVVAGVTPDWSAVLPGGRTVELPTYPFEQQRYWPDGPALAFPTGTGGGAVDTEFWRIVSSGDPGDLAGALDVDPATSLRDALPALTRWRHDRDRAATLDGWRLRDVWRPLAPQPRAATGTWLLLTPDGPDTSGGWAGAAADALADLGAATVRVPVARGADRATLAAALAAADLADDPAGVLTLLGTGDPSTTTAAATALACVQALGDAGVAAPLWCATTHAVALTPGETVAPGQHAVWGLGRVAALEHPDRWGGLVDLPATPTGRSAVHLARILTAAGVEDQVAVRPSGVSGRRLVPVTATGPTADAVLPWTGTGTVVVTGGTGGLGVELARHLAATGARRLLLLSRSGPAAPGTPELLDELRATGVDADALACDVTDQAALAAALDGEPVTAVVHAAGVLDDGVLDAVTPERLDGVLRVKADGAQHLHEVTRGHDLAAFVLFSSAAGSFGSAGQSAYAAANAHLDALALHRASLGLPATSIAWGAWAGTGLAADGAIREQRLTGAGVRPMAPADALAALDRVVTTGGPVEIVADVDLAVLTAGATALRPAPLYAELAPERDAAAPGAPDAPDTGRGLAALPAAERSRAALELVRTRAAAVLRHPDTDAVTPDRPFRDLGFDSLTAVELRNVLAVGAGVRLSATAVFDHPTPVALAAHLLDELGAGPAGSPVPEAPAAVLTADDPVVVVGMGCRLPGDADSPGALWQLLVQGRDAVGEVPAERGWNIDALYDPDPDTPGTTYARHGGFLSRPGAFDAGFFGISPREAVAMDPQQRLLLETAWEAVENAGIDPHTLRGTATGVFAGINYQDYSALAGAQEGNEGHLLTGGAGSVLSGRISYTLGLEGPAVTVDTACSASLVALHLAAQAVRSGECDLALAGGATVMATPAMFLSFSRQRGLAPDGRCKAFSDDADGTGWGEGVGVVAVERLSDARRRGHPVLAVLRGSAVNSDGASNGLTAPNGPAQQRVVRAALRNAGLAASDVDVVEAHGTGTTLGDPIEAGALLATYGQDRTRPLLLGSLKSNIGHTQAAAGIAGVIKTVLALQHGIVPATLHAGRPSSHVDWDGGAVELVGEAVGWPETGRPRRAAVSAFGIGGTNAHVVLEQAAAEPLPDRAPAPARPVGWLLSGASRNAVRAQAARLLAHLPAGSADGHLPADVALSLATTRAHLEYRTAVLGTTLDDLLGGLDALVAGDPGPVTGRARAHRATAFVFPGQGSQRAGAGAELYATHPVFADALDAVSARVDPGLERPLRDVLFAAPDSPGAALLDRTDYTQTGLFALGVALHRLLESWGITPDVVLGHSVGELAAAHVAGVLDLDDACALVLARGRLMRDLDPTGAMVAVEATEDEVVAEIGEPGPGGTVEIAAVNGPRAVVVSGDEDAVLALGLRFDALGRRTTRLATALAFHSAHVDPVLERFRAVAEGLTYHPPARTLVSDVTGAVAGREVTTPDYWVRHVRAAVRFADAVTTAAGHGADRFVELGPGGVLTALTAASLPDAGVLVPVLRTDRSEQDTLTAAVTALHCGGAAVDWAAVLDGTGARTVPLPTYAFRHEDHWTAPAAAPAAAGVEDPAAGTDAFWAELESGDVDVLAERLGVDPEHLGGVLPALGSLRRRHTARDVARTWRYGEVWRDLPAPPPAALTGPLVVAVPDGPGADGTDRGWADAVLAGLAVDGATIATVPVAADDTRAAVADRLAAAGPAERVVSLLAASGGTATTGTPAPVAATLTLVQALADAGVDAPLWCLTADAVAAAPGDRLTRPGQGAVWGLGRVHGLERPAAWGGLVDVPDAGSLPALRTLLATGGNEDQVALRDGRLLARRIDRAAVPADTVEWTPRGTVLVTGGTGALGAHVAGALAAAGAEHLVLTSRGGPAAPGADELAEGLRTAGARVDVVACDTADRAALAALLDGLPDLRAVVHAAGVGQLGATGALTPDATAAAVVGKAEGARHLHELTADRELDAFVLFSSVSATWGSAGQAAYAAANAQLDALAGHRRAAGLPGTSLAWGPWADGGMADGATAAALDHQGLRAMDPAVAVAAMRIAVAAGDGAVAIADVDWERFAPAFTAARPRPLLDELDAARAAVGPGSSGTGADDAATTALRERLTALPRADAHAELTGLVRAEAAAVLGHTDSGAVEADQVFRDLGVDSLTAVELRNRLAARTGARPSAAVVFDHPTPADLAGHLLDDVCGPAVDDVGVALADLRRIEELVATGGLVDDDRARLAQRLRLLLTGIDPAGGDDGVPDLDTASDRDLFDLVDKDLGL